VNKQAEKMDHSSVTYTLRLPSLLKARLERSAESSSLSLNQFILNLVENHYRLAGYVETTELINRGRNLRIDVKPDPMSAPGLPLSYFHIDSVEREVSIAKYGIGCSAGFLRLIGFSDKSNVEPVIADIGMALLNYHSRKNRDIAKLKWNLIPGVSNVRYFQQQDLKTQDGAYLTSVEQLLAAMQQDIWKDRCLATQELVFDQSALTITNDALRRAVQDAKNFSDKCLKLNHNDFAEHYASLSKKIEELKQNITAGFAIERSSADYDLLLESLFAGEVNARNSDEMSVAKSIFLTRKSFETPDDARTTEISRSGFSIEQ
jgi:hypothetical protein